MLSNLLASFVLIYRNSIGLILRPYQTMRAIATTTDTVQIMIILTLVGIYQLISATDTVIWTAGLFFSTIVFIALSNAIRFHRSNFSRVAQLMVYTLIPTLVWFFVSAALNLVLPPPRTSSILGKGLSLLYIAFSISILFWKIILSFLAIRFAGKFSFYAALAVLGIYTGTIFFLIFQTLHTGWLSVPFI